MATQEAAATKKGEDQKEGKGKEENCRQEIQVIGPPDLRLPPWQLIRHLPILGLRLAC
jgi:hypothetical protein